MSELEFLRAQHAEALEYLDLFVAVATLATETRDVAGLIMDVSRKYVGRKVGSLDKPGSSIGLQTYCSARLIHMCPLSMCLNLEKKAWAGALARGSDCLVAY